MRYSLTQIVIVWHHLMTARLSTEEVSFSISVFISPQITTCVKEYFGMGTLILTATNSMTRCVSFCFQTDRTGSQNGYPLS